MAVNDRSVTGRLSLTARKEHIPLSGAFELSPVCNLSCKMCYVRQTPAEVKAHSRPMVRLEQWKKIADEAFEAGMLFLLLTGGEPFLWPDFRELYEYLAEKGFLLSINSNGTMITEEVVEWLQKRPPTRINITLYGASDATYERLCGTKGMYSKVTENIDRLLQAGIPVKLNASMTPYNVGDMEEIIRFAEEKNLLLELGNYMFPPIRRMANADEKNARFTPEEAAFYTLKHRRLAASPENYRKYLEWAAKGILAPLGLDECCIDPVDGQVRCHAGRGGFWITWDGYMTPCGMMPEPKTDVYEHTFLEAWKQIVDSTALLKLSGICGRCSNKAICHCCAAMAVAETGGSSGVPKYLCEMAAEIRRLAENELLQI